MNGGWGFGVSAKYPLERCRGIITTPQVLCPCIQVLGISIRDSYMEINTNANTTPPSFFFQPEQRRRDPGAPSFGLASLVIKHAEEHQGEWRCETALLAHNDRYRYLDNAAWRHVLYIHIGSRSTTPDAGAQSQYIIFEANKTSKERSRNPVEAMLLLARWRYLLSFSGKHWKPNPPKARQHIIGRAGNPTRLAIKMNIDDLLSFASNGPWELDVEQLQKQLFDNDGAGGLRRACIGTEVWPTDVVTTDTLPALLILQTPQKKRRCLRYWRMTQHYSCSEERHREKIRRRVEETDIPGYNSIYSDSYCFHHRLAGPLRAVRIGAEWGRQISTLGAVCRNTGWASAWRKDQRDRPTLESWNFGRLSNSRHDVDQPAVSSSVVVATRQVIDRKVDLPSEAISYCPTVEDWRPIIRSTLGKTRYVRRTPWNEPDIHRARTNAAAHQGRRSYRPDRHLKPRQMDKYAHFGSSLSTQLNGAKATFERYVDRIMYSQTNHAKTRPSGDESRHGRVDAEAFTSCGWHLRLRRLPWVVCYAPLQRTYAVHTVDQTLGALVDVPYRTLKARQPTDNGSQWCFDPFRPKTWRSGCSLWQLTLYGVLQRVSEFRVGASTTIPLEGSFIHSFSRAFIVCRHRLNCRPTVMGLGSALQSHWLKRFCISPNYSPWMGRYEYALREAALNHLLISTSIERRIPLTVLGKGGRRYKAIGCTVG
ncbi:hypothetical protein ACRALDRAFT_208123 [Sodiomyces alcalophilus JCM 7366]|uniref:uncharacterized protein n=1 Tax=Sodiomyces alcalophilus JCM 7366 TaxID=591952 RepID=UPI0039B687ED